MLGHSGVQLESCLLFGHSGVQLESCLLPGHSEFSWSRVCCLVIRGSTGHSGFKWMFSFAVYTLVIYAVS